MSRKIYALLVLIGSIWFLVLVYLYFFVYYTATIVIQTNVEDYRVELFSKSTAQNWEYDCPESECLISDVSPFEYNIFIRKEEYKDEVINTKISPRKKQSFVVELTKETKLSLVESELVQETVQEKIQRLRNQDKYFASFEVGPESQVNFLQADSQLEMLYVRQGNERTIRKFPLVSEESIFVQYIGDAGEDIFVQVWWTYYIFSLQSGKIHPLPYTIPVSYIKPGNNTTEYLVVTDRWTFVYNISTQSSVFQYLFRDFIYYEDTLIGVIYKDEAQKKENFNLEEKWNLIIQYSQESKERKVLLDTNLEIDRIERKWDAVIFSVWEKWYELSNF